MFLKIPGLTDYQDYHVIMRRTSPKMKFRDGFIRAVGSTTCALSYNSCIEQLQGGGVYSEVDLHRLGPTL